MGHVRGRAGRTSADHSSFRLWSKHSTCRPAVSTTITCMNLSDVAACTGLSHCKGAIGAVWQHLLWRVLDRVGRGRIYAASSHGDSSEACQHKDGVQHTAQSSRRYKGLHCPTSRGHISRSTACSTCGGNFWTWWPPGHIC